jgi:hypothetical protein
MIAQLEDDIKRARKAGNGRKAWEEGRKGR